MRLAVGRFIVPRTLTDVSDSVERLLEQHVLPALPRHATTDPNVFRRTRLYSKVGREGVGARGRVWCGEHMVVAMGYTVWYGGGGVRCSVLVVRVRCRRACTLAAMRWQLELRPCPLAQPPASPQTDVGTLFLVALFPHTTLVP